MQYPTTSCGSWKSIPGLSEQWEVKEPLGGCLGGRAEQSEDRTPAHAAGRTRVCCAARGEKRAARAGLVNTRAGMRPRRSSFGPFIVLT